MTSRRAPLLALACAGTAMSAAACTGAADAPRPGPACQVLWASMGSTADHYDVYLVEMQHDAWFPAGVAGGERTFSFDDGVYGMVYDEFNRDTGHYFRRGVATAGTFVVTTSESVPVEGGAISLADATGQTYFTLDEDENLLGTVVATGGTATFAGEWSPEAGPPAPGAGSASVSFVGTSGALTLGGYVRYAQCFGGQSVAPISSAASRSHWPLPRFPRP